MKRDPDPPPLIHLGRGGLPVCGAYIADLLYLPQDFQAAARRGERVCEVCIEKDTRR